MSLSNNQPPESYPVGSIVNGHVWTGTEWVPVREMPSQPYVTQTFSQQFQGLPAPARIVIAVVLLGLAAYIVTFAVLPFVETLMSTP